MNSSYLDYCFVDSNTCPSTANTGCSHTKDVTIECSKLALTVICPLLKIYYF